MVDQPIVPPHVQTSTCVDAVPTERLRQTGFRCDFGASVGRAARAERGVRIRCQDHAVQDWIVPLLGVAGTLAGTGLGYRGARAINRDDRAAARREQIRAAMADYFGMLVVAVAELRDLPPRQEPARLDRALEHLQGEQGAWIARRRREFRLSGDRYRQTAAELGVAAAKLRTFALPPESSRC